MPNVDAAFSDFVSREGQNLLRGARLLTRDFDDAEDLLQNALARTHAAWARLDTTSDPTAYVFRVMVNLHISLKRVRRPVTVPLQSALASTHSNEIEGVAGRLEILDALGKLPLQQRRAVVLRYYLGYSEKETALVLGWRLGTVKSQSARGLTILRSLIDASDRAPHKSAKKELETK